MSLLAPLHGADALGLIAGALTTLANVVTLGLALVILYLKALLSG